MPPHCVPLHFVKKSTGAFAASHSEVQSYAPFCHSNTNPSSRITRKSTKEKKP